LPSVYQTGGVGDLLVEFGVIGFVLWLTMSIWVNMRVEAIFSFIIKEAHAMVESFEESLVLDGRLARFPLAGYMSNLSYVSQVSRTIDRAISKMGRQHG
jgi:hypothetical protein